MPDSPRPHYRLTFAILALAGIAFALLQSLVAPALRTIQLDLHTTTTAVAWILTGYLLSASIATPILGRLGDMFGKKRVLVATLAVVAVGTLVSALATSIGVLILGRVIQGAGGAIFPLSFSIIRDEFPRERVATGIASISALLGAGGGLGIVLAGPITEHLSYHWLFWLPLVVVVVATVAAQVAIPESPIRSPGRIDWLGATLLAAWLVALLVAISEGPSWGWASARVLILLAAAAVLFAVWALVEERLPVPLVDMRMLRARPVWTTNATALLLGFGMYSSFVLVPQFTEVSPDSGFGFGASVTEAGIFLLPATVGMLVFSPLAGRLSNTVGSKVPLTIGASATTASFVMLAFAHDERWQIFAATSLLGIGIGCAYASMANLIVEAVRPDETGVATGMNTIVRTIGGSLGSQISASIVVGYTEADFTAAFAICAAALALSVVASLAVPRRRGTRSDPGTIPAREHGDDRDEQGPDRDRALRRGRAEDRRQLRQAGAGRLLRRGRLPSRD
jgi:EmrB/QacA subfamily drug resistance transporter